MDRPKRQTATATPAKPGGLPLTLDQRFAAAITGPHPVPRTIAASARPASAPATQRIGGREGHGDGRSTREESFD